MQKRGQATLFIVIGLVIVIILGLVLFFRSDIMQSEWEQARTDSLLVPDQAEEVHSLFYDCVSEVVVEPVDKIGFQGGYISIPEDAVPISAYNTFSNNLEMFPGSDMRVAYWFYEAANGVQYDQIPSIEEMELEIAEYVDNNLARCIDDFDLLTEYNVTAGEVYTEVEILDDEVLFTIDYPVTIAMEGFYFEFPNFYESVEVPLGRMYEAAVTIQLHENENYYLEDMTYDVMFLDENVPLSEQSLDCDNDESWEVDEVIESMALSLEQNVQNVRIGGTDYEADDYSGYYVWDVLGSGFDDLSANVLYYEEWPLEVLVYPNEDGVLYSNSVSNQGLSDSILRSLFCLTDYKFIYDVKYPVLITMNDDDGYVFQFVTMVILDNNQARENELGEDYAQVEDDAICDDGVTEMTVYTDYVADDGYLYPLNDVSVKFKCGAYSCDMGNSRNGELVAVFPACYNGIVIVEKDGYGQSTEIVSTFEEGYVTVVMDEYANLSYDLKVVDYDGNIRSLTSSESAYITLVEQSTGYTVNIFYPEVTESVKLLPGVYDVEGMLMSEADFNINIPEQVLSGCASTFTYSLASVFGLEEETCVDFDIDAMNLDSMLSGTIEVEWEVDREELYGSQEVIFYLTEPMEVTSEDDIEDLMTLHELALGMVEPELR